MNQDYYKVEISENDITFARVRFTNQTPRESLDSALEYVKYAIENGFDCVVKRGDEVVGTYFSK
jgi:hypothetical protein